MSRSRREKGGVACALDGFALAVIGGSSHVPSQHEPLINIYIETCSVPSSTHTDPSQYCNSLYFIYFHFFTYVVAYAANGNATQDSSTAKLAVVARMPHKRSNVSDVMRYKLTYFTFLDDRRSFANVDALLTRLAPVGTVYVGCTEGVGADSSSTGGSGGGGQAGGGNASSRKSGQEVSELLSKLVTVLESRNDVSVVDDINLNSNSSSITVHELPTLSKAKATSLANSTLRHLLGGEASDAHLAYRGDRHLAEEPLLQWAMGYFFSADPSYRNVESDDTTCGMYGIESGTLSSHLALDRTASEAIHLLPPRSGSGAALLTGGNLGNNSLFGVLNHCKTKMGR